VFKNKSAQEVKMAKKIDPRDLSAMGRLDIENEMQELVDFTLSEQKIPTMKNKLIIEASTPGHYPALLWEKFGVEHMPGLTIDEQAENIVACVKAGASGVHSHPRDPKGKHNYEVQAGRDMDGYLTAEIMDKAYKEVDFVPLHHCWHPKNWEGLGEADFITPTQQLLDVGKGNKYIQGNVMPTWIYPWCREGLLSSWFTAKSLREGVAFLEANNVKPLIALHFEHIMWFKNNVIDAGVFKTPPHLNIQEGKHGQNMSFSDPMSHIRLLTSLEMTKNLVPDCTIGLHAGGRNWLPMVVTAIMAGVDLVRIGIEDQFWATPHKDEILKSPVESIRKVVQISQALGRDIATPKEARKILGVKVTSK
jgi:uncharacterized protein (DUF849 family)